MGMDQRVTFEMGMCPRWGSVAELLAQHGFPVQMRMIDGEPSFPDEAPPEGWRELRVGTSQGMVTVRREGEAVLLVTWGNADAALRQVWNALAWAFAEKGGGQMHAAAAIQSAEEFRCTADLPACLRPAERSSGQ